MTTKLGQHFLSSHGALRTICAEGAFKEGDSILEIGPGKGVLTRALLESGAVVVAIEKDTTLVQLLKESFASYIAEGKLTLIEDDIRNINPDVFCREPYTLIANIPYYITGEIIRTFLSCICKPKRMVLLIQKEVAERIIERGGKRSLLSLSVQVYGKPAYIKTVPRGSFNPPPRVDSAILTISDISNNFFEGFSENFFFSVIHAGFGQKRKQLATNLAQKFNKEKKDIEALLVGCGLTASVRAEDVSLILWKDIVRGLQKMN